MKLKVLSSGSHGNCYIISSQTGCLVLEAGLPWNKIQQGLNYDTSKVIACLISHSHMDHAKAVKEVMAAGIDTYMSKQTAETLGLNSHRLCILEPKKQCNIGDSIIMPFEAEHDADGALGFLIQNKKTGEKLLYLTDSYYCKYKFRGLNYIMIECNYCKDILDRNIEAGLIDEAMKRRLLESHMSLEHCKQFLKANDLSQCKKIILIHLSEGNSDEKRMVREIEQLTGIETVAASEGLEIELNMLPY